MCNMKQVKEKRPGNFGRLVCPLRAPDSRDGKIPRPVTDIIHEVL